ncbi:hypothetical protein [Shewanella sp.]|uniref:hypothetical protein n=1 Tax=Shewanella sp. TaxID=50422 RepID=UPI003567CD98
MSIEPLFSSNIIVPIVVAFIGFLVAVTTAVIAKEQKVSEFRQAWIDSLRNESSELIGIAYSLTVQMEKIKSIKKDKKNNKEILHGDLNDAYLLRLELYIKLRSLSSKIILRLNIDEHEELIKSLNDLNSIHLEDIDPEVQFLQLNNLKSLLQPILKSEWEKVKKGEFIFRFMQNTGKILSFSMLTVFFIIIISSYFPSYCPLLGQQ